MEIICDLKEDPEEVHDLIGVHLKEQLDGWSTTKFEQSFDGSNNLYRFDMNPQGRASLFLKHAAT